MNLQHLLDRKARGQRVADGDHFCQIDIDGQLYDGQITDVEALSAHLPDGREMHEVKILVRYRDAAGERYAEVSRSCTAAAGCRPDWSRVLCAWVVDLSRRHERRPSPPSSVS